MNILKAGLLVCSVLFASATLANPPAGSQPRIGDRLVTPITNCNMVGCWTDTYHYVWTANGWMLVHFELGVIPEDARVQ